MADPPPSYEDVGAALEMPVGSIGPTRARCLERPAATRRRWRYQRRPPATLGRWRPDERPAPGARGRPDDDVLLDELRALVADDDPVPERVLAAARGSFTWRTIDAELAALVYDSALDAERLTAVRSADTVRLLTFETAELGDRARGDGRR